MNLKHSSGILPIGFQASGISAKIKKSGKKDLALFFSKVPCTASALFTANSIKAAPVLVSQRHLKSGAPQALIVNSGNANCMTGKKGQADAYAMAQAAANELFLNKKNVLVASTGIIGKFLPVDRIKKALPELKNRLSSKGLSDAAWAIMTTDTFPKEVCVRVKIGDKVVTLAGIAKGAGMIAPDLKSATMLAFIFTDARIEKKALDKFLKRAVEISFNAITIDGCMSTNDTVLVMANGQAGPMRISSASKEGRIFARALNALCLELAKSIVRDAEGATKFIEINVKGAAGDAQAKTLALGVANSNLFKCAMFGSDPNWGRIAAALGSAGPCLKWEKLDIAINKKTLFKNGNPVVLENKSFLKSRSVVVDIDLNSGGSQSTVYTSDLSYGYVRINADYN
jgi:glutamate N-acetyltransferase/amino-acid N-acetyltransferase